MREHPYLARLAGVSLIFDLDGTLVDSAPDLCDTLNHVLESHGRSSVDHGVVRMMVGQGARVLIEEGFRMTGDPVEPARMEPLFDAFIAYYRAHIADRSQPYAGVRDALNRYAGAGAKLGVCTNKPFALSAALLNTLDLDRFFSVILGADSLPVRKPHPEHYRQTVLRLGGRMPDSVMIGDSPTDVATARAAGVPIVAVTFGYTPVPPESLGADALVDHFDALDAALLDVLENRGER